MLLDSRKRLIEKGLYMLAPSLENNSSLYYKLYNYVISQLDSPNKVAVLYIFTDSFMQLLKDLDVNPENFIGNRELVVSNETVAFSEDYHFYPKEIFFES